MSYQIQYNDFPTFLPKMGSIFQTFNYKVQKISLNAGFTCPNRDGTKDGKNGCIWKNCIDGGITRLSIRTIAGRKSRLLPNWRRGNVSLPINIRR